MKLEILPVALKKEQLQQLFPSRVCNYIDDNDTRIYAAIDGNKIKAAAVMSASESIYEGYVINHITLCGDENLDTFNLLMDYIEAECKEVGAKMICARMLLEEDCESIKPFLYARDYDDLSSHGMYLCYKVSDILNTLFASKLDTMKPLLKNVKCYNELTRNEVAIFRRKLEDLDAELEFNMPDLVFGRFYMLNGEIVGYMDTKELKPGQLYLDSTYIEENEKTKYALPAMIASLMMALEALMGDEATISMQILNPHLLKGVRAMYGYAPVELDVLEMFKQI